MISVFATKASKENFAMKLTAKAQIVQIMAFVFKANVSVLMASLAKFVKLK